MMQIAEWRSAWRCLITELKQILLVEDNLAHQALIQRAFDAWPDSMQLIFMTTLAAARVYLADNHPDLVFADYRLPDGAGSDLLPNHNGTPLLPYPVVIMAEQGDEYVAVETIKAGARDYVIKSDITMADMPHIASRVMHDWRLMVDHQATEAALIESEERYRLLVDRSPDAIAVFDKDFRVLFANTATANLLAVDKVETLLGRSFLELIDIDAQQDAKDRVAEMLRTGVSLPSREYCFTRLDGKTIYGLVTSMPLIYRGEPAIQIITHDVTKRRLAEIALQRAHDELEDKVNERTRELELANEKLLELDKLKSMFIASMSHELRTPLNSIIGFTGIILQGMSGEINDSQKDQLSRVYASAIHLLALVSDVIDISKIEAGKIGVDIEDFTVAPLIDECVELVSKMVAEKGLSLEVTIPADIVLVSDRRRLLQIVLNMLSNAVKYTEAGRVSISAEQHGERLRISIADTGVGISKEAMQRLFKPFERLDTVLRVKVLGTGLGLYLSKKLAEDLLQGELGAHSEYGSGSTFWVDIPMKLAAKTAG